MAAADPGRMAGQWPPVRAVRRLEHRAHGAGHQELEIQPEEFRLPAARARLAQRPVRRRARRCQRRRRPRLGRQLPRAASAGPGLHLVEQSRRGARQQCGLAHRLPTGHPRPARRPEGLLDLPRRTLLRPRAVHRGLRAVRQVEAVNSVTSRQRVTEWGDHLAGDLATWTHLGHCRSTRGGSRTPLRSVPMPLETFFLGSGARRRGAAQTAQDKTRDAMTVVRGGLHAAVPWAAPATTTGVRSRPCDA
ncbi:conserved hypothetical protein [Xanthomonas citri pv. citri]|nr:conserved hypothetical protein [Xanthomonas citri pv. citri]